MIVDMHITSMYVTRVCSYEPWYLQFYEWRVEMSTESVPKILPRIRWNGHSLLASSRWDTWHNYRLTNHSRCRKWALLLSTHSLLPSKMFTFTGWSSFSETERTWNPIFNAISTVIHLMCSREECSRLALHISLQCLRGVFVPFFSCPLTTLSLWICLHGFSFYHLEHP